MALIIGMALAVLALFSVMSLAFGSDPTGPADPRDDPMYWARFGWR